MSEDAKRALLCSAGIIVVLVLLLLIFTPTGKGMIQNWTNSMKEVEEVSYNNQKKVEDTARAMISSYKSDKLTYETYINSEDDEEKSWAKQAQIRANATANSYNEYIRKNSHIWRDNLPSDIDYELTIIEQYLLKYLLKIYYT